MQTWMEYIQKSFNVEPDLIVYLRAPPEQVFERIKCRNRSEENGISLDYLQRIHELHDDWLLQREHNGKVPIIVLDATLNEAEIQTEYKKIMDQIAIATGEIFPYFSF